MCITALCATPTALSPRSTFRARAQAHSRVPGPKTSIRKEQPQGSTLTEAMYNMVCAFPTWRDRDLRSAGFNFHLRLPRDVPELGGHNHRVLWRCERRSARLRARFGGEDHDI